MNCRKFNVLHPFFLSVALLLLDIINVFFYVSEICRMSRTKRVELSLENGGCSISHAPAVNSPPIDKSSSRQSSRIFEFFCGGGGIFFCTLLLGLVMIFLIIQLLIWRIFDIDVFPVDDTISNKELSNYTFSSFHRPKD